MKNIKSKEIIFNKPKDVILDYNSDGCGYMRQNSMEHINRDVETSDNKNNNNEQNIPNKINITLYKQNSNKNKNKMEFSL